MDIQVSRLGNYILREWDNINKEERTEYMKPCHDYLEYKRRAVAEHYYGSDDEGEAKDIKKNISTSFKKFMQIQQLNKPVSVVSEH